MNDEIEKLLREIRAYQKSTVTNTTILVVLLFVLIVVEMAK